MQSRGRHVGTLCLLFIVALLSGVGMARADSSIVGFWFGQHKERESGRLVHWLVDRRADGTFAVEFRVYRNCGEPQVQHEAGIWRLANNLYSTVTQNVNGKPTNALVASYNDSYLIESLMSDEMVYTHVKSGKRYIAQRVASSFEFPPCALSS